MRSGPPIFSHLLRRYHNFLHVVKHQTTFPSARGSAEILLCSRKYFGFIASNSNLISVFMNCSRQHVSNWSMAKENHDPGSTSTKQTSKLMQQKSLEKTHHSPNHDSPQTTKLKSSSDLFELLERCQSQRLDDQRCVLPSYFSQVSRTNLHNFKFCGEIVGS